MINAEMIGMEYLNKLCVHIYSKYGVTMFDFSKGENDIPLLLDYINRQCDFIFCFR